MDRIVRVYKMDCFFSILWVLVRFFLSKCTSHIHFEACSKGMSPLKTVSVSFADSGKDVFCVNDYPNIYRYIYIVIVLISSQTSFERVKFIRKGIEYELIILDYPMWFAYTTIIYIVTFSTVLSYLFLRPLYKLMKTNPSNRFRRLAIKSVVTSLTVMLSTIAIYVSSYYSQVIQLLIFGVFCCKNRIFGWMLVC